jgi:hypothetical protein
MADLNHDDIWDFPNGKGFRECTREYRNTLDEKLAICDLGKGEQIADLSAADYDRWMRLDMKLDDLQMAGHLGEVHIFEQRAA